MPANSTPVHTADMIRGTFEMMLREWGHRGTAVRFTCRDLGVLPDEVLSAVGSGAPEPRQPRSH